MNGLSKLNTNNDLQTFSGRYKQSLVILECGSPFSTSLTANDTTLTYTIFSVYVDTSCFCKPFIKFDFSCNINVPDTAGGPLVFQIYKVCTYSSQLIPIGSSWIFQSTGPTSKLFTFFVSDSDNYSNEGSTYVVKVTASIETIDHGVLSFISIRNALLLISIVENVNENF